MQLGPTLVIFAVAGEEGNFRSSQSYFDHTKSLGATNLCLRYAPAKCGKFDVSQRFFQSLLPLSRNLTPTLRTIIRTRIAKVTNFFPFCTIGISMYQKRILPYFIIPSTFSPQASSPLNHHRRTEKILHPLEEPRLPCVSRFPFLFVRK